MLEERSNNRKLSQRDASIKPLDANIGITSLGIRDEEFPNMFLPKVGMDKSFKFFRRRSRNTEHNSNKIAIVGLPFVHSTKEVDSMANFDAVHLPIKANRSQLRKAVAIDRRWTSKLRTTLGVVRGLLVAGG